MRRWLPFLLVIVIAIVLRVFALDVVPPGLQHDEVFHGHDAVTVLLGNHPLYFTSNAGNEPLFIYLMSITIGLLGHNVWGIRLAAVICGLLTILFTYLWIRRAYNNRTALIASALMAFNFWPLFLSRVGLRAASLPMVAALTAWLFFRGLQAAEVRNQDSEVSRQKRARYASFILAGAALGLTLYTYPAARVLPIVFLIFWILHSAFSKKIHTPTLIALVVALIVFAPLAYTIVTQPDADVRLQQLSGPVQELVKGDLEPVLRYTRDTLGLFTFNGDPIARYNLPGRPVFDPITGILFYLGIVLAIKHGREPRNLFALIWLPIGLLPSMLSDSAPSFLRASASLPVTFLFPALALDWLFNRPSIKAQRILSVLVLAWLVVITVFTIRDYFVVWPNRSDVREVYRSDLALAAKWVAQQPLDQPIAIASTNPRDLDPFLFDFQLPDKHEIKWFDRAFGLVMPSQPGKVISPAFSPLDPWLRQNILSTYIPLGLASGPQTITFEDGSPAFEVFDVQPYPKFTSIPRGPLFVAPGASPNNNDLGPAIEFVGYGLTGGARAGESLPLNLSWRVVKDTAGAQLPLSLFVHLLDERGEFAAGRDLLAFPTAGWQEGDWWKQQNDVPIPANLPPGQYQIEFGVYSQADGTRWRVYDPSGKDIGDRVLLGAVTVTK